MERGFKKLKYKDLTEKIIVFLLLISNLAIYSSIFWESAKLAKRWGIERISDLAYEEQLLDAEKVMDNLSQIEEKSTALEKELEDILKLKRIDLEKKKDLMAKLEDLEEDCLRHQGEFYAYNADESIKINPWRDESIDEVFKKSWLLPLTLSRMIREYEFAVFRGYLTEEQFRLIKEDFGSIRYQIDDIKKQYSLVKRT